MNNLLNDNYLKKKYLKYKSKYLYYKNNLIGGDPREEIINQIYSLLKINSERIIQSFLIGRIRVEPFSIPYTDKDQTIMDDIRKKVNPLLIKQLVEWLVDTRARFDLHLSVSDTHIEINLEIIPLFGCLILDDRAGRKRIIKTDDCIILEQKLTLSQDIHKYQKLGNLLRRHFTLSPHLVEPNIVSEDEYNFIDILNSRDLESLRVLHEHLKKQ
jgi:hypothetical protein